MPGAKSRAVRHHVRYHRQARLVGAVRAGAVKSQRVMEAGLAGLEDGNAVSHSIEKVLRQMSIRHRLEM